ncbi:hypothetical protein HYC85_003889 [Camellia sinensis]|uniref:Terpene synthase N-terminal domain-containing protein n=1 Tax=Camellia sinensis TaxID=4442 RepID=A0A7J7HX45_CAMSI|nr:hypothetical protein HYC85_003889 [Camellia sinensis]
MELSIRALPIPDSTKIMVPEATRRSANYHPSIWGDHFLTYASHAVEVDVKMGQQLQQQKEEVRKMLVAANDQPSQKLNFIDAIQHLGVSYHFESEIEAALQHIYETDYDHHDDKANDDLYTVALSFRLLRQQGYPISCDVFNKFKDDNGKIRESLIGDVRGMLSLYEAAHLRVWEINAIDQLPEYMKQCYQALLDVYNMIDEEMARKGTSYCVHYAKSAMKNLVRAYFEEAKWFHQGYVPSIEEYMRVALVTGAYTMLATTSLVGMGEVVSKEAFDWVSSDPLVVQASSIVCRLMNDIVS